MKKRTHFALSRQLVKDNPNNFNFLEKNLFYFGSIFPDCTPLCVLHPHMFDVTNKSSRKRMLKLFYRKKPTVWDSFRLGALSHHVADYFTAPHNRKGVGGFVKDHRGYENELHRVFKKHLKNEGAYIESSRINRNEFWKTMKNRHDDYIESNKIKENMDKDLGYIKEAVTNLFHLYHARFTDELPN